MSNKYHLKPLALALLATLSTSTTASDESYQTLDESVVSASGYEQDTREAPASISIVTQSELERQPSTDIGEAIQDVPGVDIEQTKMGGHTIRLRGFESKYTLIMIDGKRQNVDSGFTKNGFDPTGSFLPPTGAIERIEVLRGPASTVYGSDAIGGVVNIITKKHPDRLTGSIGMEGTLQEDSRYGNSWSTNVYLGIPLVDNTLSLTLRGRYFGRSADNVRDPAGNYASHSPSEGFTGNLGGRLTWTLDQANTVYFDADYHRFQGGSMSTTSDGTKSLWWATKHNFILAHQGHYSFGDTDTYFQYNGLENTNTTDELSTADYIFSTKLVSPLDFKDWGSMMLSTGLEVMYDTFQDDSSAGTGKPDVSGNEVNSTIAGKTLDHTQISAFLEGEYFMTDEWSTTVGARATWSDIFGTHIAPRAYLVWKPSEVISFKGGVANGYKTPAVKELTDGVYEVNGGGSLNGDRVYYPRYGNPDLQPEESWNYELSTDIRLYEFVAVTVTGFYTRFKNKIDYEATYGTGAFSDYKVAEQLINLGRVDAKGVEVSIRTQPIYGVSFSAGYTYTDSKVKTESAQNYNKPVSSLPRHSITARADYEKNNFNAFVRMRAKLDTPNIASKTGLPDTTYPDFNNWTTVDVGLGYRFQKHHRIAFNINNVFDKEFVDWGETVGKGGSVSYTNLFRDYQTGRNYWLSYNYDF